MDRKKFISQAFIGGISGLLGTSLLKAQSSKAAPATKAIEQVGFNHLPNKEIRKMKTVLHKAASRGHANHGWLNSHHSFSFANYYNPERMQFGMLRVLNDDTVAPGRGFGTHPHRDMEIISIPLEGDLEHKDSMGNTAVIKQGDVQVLSAGTGILHSEYNKNQDKTVKFLQIWVMPRQGGVKPRYDQISLTDVAKPNELYQILSPSQDDQGVWIHQDAWFHLAEYEAGKADGYKLKKAGNGVYAFVLSGSLSINGESLEARDGLGMWELDELEIKADSDARLLLMEVPMS